MTGESEMQYLRDNCVAEVVEDILRTLVSEKPRDPLEFLSEYLGKNKGRILINAKLTKAKQSKPFIHTFLDCYKELQSGSTGYIRESSIEPAHGLVHHSSLEGKLDESLLNHAAVCKLNGGLGTGMGLEKAKSLLPVRGDDTFLDLIVKQILHLREKHKAKLEFYLLNAFQTSKDTKKFLAKYKDINARELYQHQAPKIAVGSLLPVSHPRDPAQEWNPPGHGDLYSCLYENENMKKLLERGIKYMFVSNSDNLGATLDVKLLTYFANSGAPMLMEVCDRTEADKKGGHLARDKTTKQLLLRESAQCAPEDESFFQDIALHKYFNTNNLWINIEKLQQLMEAQGGFLKLPVIRNAKTVDPRDSATEKVYQVEVAMGSAIATIPGSQAIIVGRERFSPVKTCNDLFAVRSDVYQLHDDYTLTLAKERPSPPVIDLDSKHYKFYDKFDECVSNGVPSLLKLANLKVTGSIVFAEGVTLEGNVEIINQSPTPKEVRGQLKDQTVTL